MSLSEIKQQLIDDQNIFTLNELRMKFSQKVIGRMIGMAPQSVKTAQKSDREIYVELTDDGKFVAVLELKTIGNRDDERDSGSFGTNRQLTRHYVGNYRGRHTYHSADDLLRELHSQFVQRKNVLVIN